MSDTTQDKISKILVALEPQQSEVAALLASMGMMFFGIDISGSMEKVEHIHRLLDKAATAAGVAFATNDERSAVFQQVVETIIDRP